MQRCLLHVWRDTVRDLTRHLATTPGRALLAHARQLLRVQTTQQAAWWMGRLNDYGNEYRAWLNQRTTAAQDPATAQATGRKWWYTHERVRRAYRRLARLAAQGTLFNYLATDPPAQRTTNPVESTNQLIRQALRNHRGATAEHQGAIIEWTLARRTSRPPQAASVITNWISQGQPPRQRIPNSHTPTPQTHPAGWGATPTPEEGLWARQSRHTRNH